MMHAPDGDSMVCMTGESTPCILCEVHTGCMFAPCGIIKSELYWDMQVIAAHDIQHCFAWGHAGGGA